MLEAEMVLLSSAQLRHREAVYFCDQFVACCEPPQDSFFHMNCYFDAFLFSLVSVEEIVDEATKQQLRGGSTFVFVKALRNVTTHHSVLAGSAHDAKFVRPFSRRLSNDIGDAPNASGNLVIHFDRMREVFAAVEVDWPREKPTLDVARDYLTGLEAERQPVNLIRVMHAALAEVQAIVG